MNKRFAAIRQQYMGSPELPRALYEKALDFLMRMSKKERKQYLQATISVIKTLNHDYPNGVIIPAEPVKAPEVPTANPTETPNA